MMMMMVQNRRMTEGMRCRLLLESSAPLATKPIMLCLDANGIARKCLPTPLCLLPVQLLIDFFVWLSDMVVPNEDQLSLRFLGWEHPLVLSNLLHIILWLCILAGSSPAIRCCGLHYGRKNSLMCDARLATGRNAAGPERKFTRPLESRTVLNSVCNIFCCFTNTFDDW